MTQNLNAATQQQVADFLPKALETACLSYEIYTDEIDHSNKEQFPEYHKNCKAALAHIELLLKLARLVDVPEEAVDAVLIKHKQEALKEVNEHLEN